MPTLLSHLQKCELMEIDRLQYVPLDCRTLCLFQYVGVLLLTFLKTFWKRIFLKCLLVNVSKCSLFIIHFYLLLSATDNSLELCAIEILLWIMWTIATRLIPNFPVSLPQAWEKSLENCLMRPYARGFSRLCAEVLVKNSLKEEVRKTSNMLDVVRCVFPHVYSWRRRTTWTRYVCHYPSIEARD